MDNQKNKYLNLLAKKLNNKTSAEEQKELEQWANENEENKKFVEETTKTWNLVGDYVDDLPIDSKSAWTNIQSHISTAAPQETKVRSIFKTWQAVAAALIVVSLSVWWLYNSNNTVEPISPVLAKVSTGVGEQKEVKLPDGSTVMLNQNSSLAYNKEFKNRQVTLEGEAFFEVTKQDGAKFEIKTAKTQTTVLGTSFNVRAYKSDSIAEVTVFTGKVAFQELEKEENKVLLLPKDRAVFNKTNQQLKKDTVAQQGNAIAWKTQELIFENTSFIEVINILERYFDVLIEVENENILNCHYTGTFSDPQLQDILDAVHFTTNIKSKKVGLSYILTGEGCKSPEF
ncbi:MAG: DUF4974 domain-containing protein [Aureispira sp.]|nr:DUF4974 domain-containing protein [Aureispira sp.]